MRAEEMVKRDFVMVDASQPVSKLAGLLEKSNTAEGFIFDGERFEGVFDHEHFFRSKISAEELKAGNFIKKVAKLKKDDNLLEIATQMVNSDSMILPVFDGESFMGGVHVYEVLKNSKTAGLKNVNLDKLKKYIPPLYEDEGIAKTLKYMYKNHLREMIVFDKKGGLTGMVQHHGLMQKYYKHLVSKIEKAGMAYKHDIELKELPVKNLISEQDVKVEESTDLNLLATEVVNNNTYNVFLKENEDYYVITAKDILKVLVNHQRPMMENVHFIGLDKANLEEFTKNKIYKAAYNYSEKFKRHTKEDFDLSIHVKEYSSEGKQHKYSVNARLNMPSRTLASQRAYGWDAVAAVRMACDSIQKQLEG